MGICMVRDLAEGSSVGVGMVVGVEWPLGLSAVTEKTLESGSMGRLVRVGVVRPEAMVWKGTVEGRGGLGGVGDGGGGGGSR